jgi:hypothetical protein
MERIIAAALGTSPATIWPNRYDDNGQPLPRSEQVQQSPRREQVAHGGDTASAAKSALNSLNC